MSHHFQLHQMVRLKGLNNTLYNGKLARVRFFPTSEVFYNGRYRVDLIDEVAPSLHQPVEFGTCLYTLSQRRRELDGLRKMQKY